MEQKETTLPKFNQSIWTKAIEITVIALIILVPIVFYPYILNIFHPVKELTTTLLVVIGMMFWGFKIINEEKIQFISTPLNLPVLGFMAICALSLFWSDSPFISLKELPLFLSGPLLYFIVVNNVHNEKQINRIISAILIIGGLFGIYGILQYNGIDFLFWVGNVERGKVFGLFGNAGYFAEYLILPLPIAVSLFLVSKNKIIKSLLLIGILTMASAIALTFSRTPYLSLVISFIFMLLLFVISRGKRLFKENKKIIIVILTTIVLIVSLFVIPTSLNEKGTVLSKIKERVSISQLGSEFFTGRRVAIWKYTIPMIKDYPLLGSGIGTYKYNTLKYQAIFFDRGENRSLYPHGFADKAHNEYLQLWAELGIIGLGIFLWLIISYFNYGFKNLRKIKNKYRQGIIIGLMGSIVAFLVDAIFWFPMHQPVNIVLFWLILGLTFLELRDNEVCIDKKIQIQKNIKEKTKREKDDDIFRFKPLLYISIILLIAFTCFTVVRPFIAQIYWYYGNQEIKNNNYNKSIKIYEKALKYDPYLGQAYYDLGLILNNKGFSNAAQEYFEKAEKYFDHPELPRNLAIVYLSNQNYEKAVSELKQAISYKKDEESMLPLYAELGNAYITLKRYKPAEIALKEALKIDPDFINAHYGLASVYLKENKTEEALKELQKIIEIDPDSIQARFARDTLQKITQEELKEKIKIEN
jgi:O-antigen ligase/Tfp pilus assembly protein PilF